MAPQRRTIAGLALGLLAVLVVGGSLRLGVHRAGNARLVSVDPPQVRRTCNPPGTGGYPARPGSDCFLYLTLDTHWTTQTTPGHVIQWGRPRLRLGQPDAQLVAGLGPTGARHASGSNLTELTVSLYVAITWRVP
jgi:hypothetical protein